MTNVQTKFKVGDEIFYVVRGDERFANPKSYTIGPYKIEDIKIRISEVGWKRTPEKRITYGGLYVGTHSAPIGKLGSQYKSDMNEKNCFHTKVGAQRVAKRLA